VSYSKIDETVLGNLSRQFHDALLGWTSGLHPKFNMEHFGEHELTVVGRFVGEYVGIHDKAGEFDSGHHVFTGLNTHIDGDV
jgi:hypothetical protein